MKRRSFSLKKLAIGFLAAVCFVCSALSLGLMNKKIKSVSATTDATSFSVSGASVRVTEPDGFRFVAQIESGELSSYGQIKGYGMMLVPQEKDSGELTVSYTDGEYVASNASAVVIEGGEWWSETLREKYGIASDYEVFSCALLAEQGSGDEAVRFPESLYNTPLTAVAFIQPESGEIVYTQKMTRSISYVALLETLSSEYEEKECVERIADALTVDFSFNGGKELDNKALSYEPSLTLGGISAEASSVVTVTYQSSNESVAQVVDGKVKAIADGEATITATVKTDSAKQFTATTQVSVVSKVAISAAAATAGGTVAGAGTYGQGDSVTLTATTTDGYTFDGWYNGSNKVGNALTYTFVAQADVALQAKWKINTYTVKLTAGTGGSVTGAGTYEHGKSITITATPSTGYNFTKWSDGKTSASRTITVTSAVDLTATFTKKTYTVSVSAATVGGTVSGGGTKSYGSSVTLKATTNSGYTFLGWYNESDIKVDSSPNYTFTVTNAVVLKAKWKAGALTSTESTWRAKQGYNYYYFTQLGPEVMPIGAWSSPPPNIEVWDITTNHMTLANYQTLAASGINAIYGLYDFYDSDIQKGLELAEQTNMVYFVRDSNPINTLSTSTATSATLDQYSKYMSKAAYGGTLLIDEPGYDNFDEIGKAYINWRAHEVYGDNKLALVNNLPIYSTAAQLYYSIRADENAIPPKDFTGANFESWV